METALLGLEEVQALEDGLAWDFSVGRDKSLQPEEYFLKFPVLFIVGDTPAHNKIVGLKTSPQVCRCRLCSVKMEDMDNPHIQANDITRNNFAKDTHLPKKTTKGYHSIRKNIF